ncbi:hypothetical protein VTO42DRAFT_6757 [Malbranchea cinnamomea]
MLAGISARQSATAGVARQFSLQSHRQISYFAPQRRIDPFRPSRGEYGGALSTNNGRLKSLALPVASVRFSSSTSTPSTGSASTPEPAWDASITDLPDMDLASVPEKLGFLKTLGLDYGFGISTIIERLLEVLHIHGGLTWGGSALAAAILLRALLIKPTLMASDTSAKMQSIRDQTRELNLRMYQAVQAGNRAEQARAGQEIRMLKEKHGIKVGRLSLPLVQVPIGYCCYKVMKGMATLPVPSLASENLGWIGDLTMADPYYILPVMTSAMIFLSIKRGGETGVSTMSENMRSGLMYGLPALSFMFMFFQPGLVQVYFAATGALSLTQTYLLTNPSFRQLVGIAPLPVLRKPEDGESSSQSRIRMAQTIETKPVIETPPKASFIDRAIDKLHEKMKGFRNAMGDVRKLFRQEQEKQALKRYTETELKQAKSYEQRRRMELEYERDMLNAQRRVEHLKKMGSKGN